MSGRCFLSFLLERLCLKSVIAPLQLEIFEPANIPPMREGPRELYNTPNHHSRQGFALCVALVLLLLCASLAVAWVNSTSLNVSKADSFRKVCDAQYAAESGMGYMIHEVQGLDIAAGSSGQELLDNLASALQARLDGTRTLGGSNVAYNGVTISTPWIDVGDGEKSFLATLTLVGDNGISLQVTGYNHGIRRAVGVAFDAVSGDSPIFDFGIASKSPVEMTGNASVEGLNSPVEAQILSATDEINAFDLTGNVDLDGDIYTTNPAANVSMTGNVTIGGKGCRDDDVYDHIHIGLGAGEFPEVDPTVFEPFATNIIDSSTKTNGNKTFSNIRIKAGTNPTFSGNMTIKGVIFIEAPNNVHFSGNTIFTGVIVTEDAGDDVYEENTIKFTGNLTVRGIEELPDTAEFHSLREMPGAFVLAPGFGLQFTGNFGTVSGCMAADAFKFSGNAGGIVRGGIINYSDSSFKLTGNSRVIIDRDGTPDIPPGFVMSLTLEVKPGTYVEVPVSSIEP